MGTIRYVLRSDKKLKTGHSPIELTYQIKSDKKRFNTGKAILAECWNKTTQKAIYIEKKDAKKLAPAVDYNLFLTDRQANNFNDDLRAIITAIEKIEIAFKDIDFVYTVSDVIEALKDKLKPTEKKEQPSKYVYDFIDKYINDHAATREPGSLSVYKSLKVHLQEFELYKKKKVTFDKIDTAFFQSFQNYLIAPHPTFVKSKKKDNPGQWKTVSLNNTTIAKQLSTLKTFLNYAKAQGIEISDKYKNFKIKRETLEVIALTNTEFESIFYLDLSNNKRLERVRDVFCFSCTSGLRYSDLKQLKREHIKNDEIKLTVKKTKVPLVIPLSIFSKSILAKYEGLEKPIPVITNQRLNLYVKELCKLAGITEPIEIVRYRGIKREAITYPKYELIGVHTGRKTFVCLSLEKGMSTEEVMACTGHSDYASFKRYVKITEVRKKVVMAKAWGGNLSEIKLKAV